MTILITLLMQAEHSPEHPQKDADKQKMLQIKKGSLELFWGGAHGVRNFCATEHLGTFT